MNNTMTAVFLFLTVGAYALSRVAAKRWPSPFTTPVFFSTAIIITILLSGGYSVADYADVKNIITYFLGPVTVALAIPLYKNRKVFMENLMPILIGLVAGSVSTMVIAVGMAKLCGFSAMVVASISIKSVSAPIAIELAPMIYADPTLTACFVVITGMLGSMVGLRLLSLARVSDPLARGLSMGVISHGQGTAQALTEGEVAGAAASIAMGLAAVWVPIVAPAMLKLLG